MDLEEGNGEAGGFRYLCPPGPPAVENNFVAYNAPHRLIFVARGDGAIHGYDQSGELRCTFVKEGRVDPSFALFTEGDTLVSAAFEKDAICVWRIPELQDSGVVVVHEFEEVGKFENVLSMDCYGGELAVGNKKGEISMVDLASHTRTKSSKGHALAIFSVRFYTKPGPFYLVSGSKDKTVKIWDLALVELIKLEFRSGVFCVNLFGDYLLCATTDLSVWKVAELEEFLTSHNMPYPYKTIDCSQQSVIYNVACFDDFIVTSSKNRSIAILDGVELSVIQTTEVHSDAVTSAAITPGPGPAVVTTSRDGTSKLWPHLLERAAARRDELALKRAEGPELAAPSTDDGTLGGTAEESTTAPAPPAPLTKAQREEAEMKDAIAFRNMWQKRRKHAFVFSNAGKPIFTRWGDEQEFADFFGVMMALLSFVIDSGDTLNYLAAGDHLYVFYIAGPLYFVMVSQTGEPYTALREQLVLLNAEIILNLTNTMVLTVFQRQPNFDLRRKLGGANSGFHSLIKEMTRMPSAFLQSVPCLPLESNVRKIIANTMVAANFEDRLFAVMFTEMFLIQMVNYGQTVLKAMDVFLLMNYINNNAMLRQTETGSVVQMCLPQLQDTAYVYAYVRFIGKVQEGDSEIGLCMCLISASAGSEFIDSSQECMETIVESLTQKGILTMLMSKIRIPLPKTPMIPELRHLMYKSNFNTYAMTAFDPPYKSNAKRKKRILRLYSTCRNRTLYGKSKDKFCLFNMTNEMIAISIGIDYELYCTFNPLSSKAAVSMGMSKAKKWVKQHMDVLLPEQWSDSR